MGEANGRRPRRSASRFAFAVVWTVACTALWCTRAQAATIDVTTTGDTVAVDGLCSLREAIQAANDDLAIVGAGSGSTSIATQVITPGP
ncbi:MAG TPA: CSLREA domain-containing protein [Candidatus Binatia bacterium]|jgi:CSLREA domain-containing protein